MLLFAFTLALLVTGRTSWAAEYDVDLELILAVDVSFSISTGE